MDTDFDIVSDLTEGTADFTPTGPGTETASSHAAAPVAQQTREALEPKQVVADEPGDQDKPKSVRDLLSSALKGQQDTPEGAQQDGGQVRNLDGTFAAKPADPPVLDPNAAPKVAAPTGIDPQVFASLPAETQAQLARTMEDVNTRQQRFQAFEPLEQLITPRIEAWALNGMRPEQAVHQLFALSDFAGRDTAGFIKYIAQQNNVDLEELVLGMDDDEVVPVDPAIQAMQKELSELRGWKDGQTQEQQQAKYNGVVNEVLVFTDEKGQDGQPLRPHLSELGQSWLPYIEMVKSANPTWSHGQVLQQAYENACWASPTVRAKMQQATDAAAAAERIRKDAAKVEAARAASASVRTGSPSAPAAAPNEPGTSTRDVIRAAMAQHS